MPKNKGDSIFFDSRCIYIDRRHAVQLLVAFSAMCDVNAHESAARCGGYFSLIH